MEDPDILLGDEATKVIINATGNRTGLSDEMSAFLDFILTGKGNSSFTHKLEQAVETVDNIMYEQKQAFHKEDDKK